MTQAFSRIDASRHAVKARVSDAFKKEAGAFDLPSILVGVVVVGVLTAGVLASIFGVIPFAQNKGAQQDLGAITTAQGVYKAQIAEGLNYAETIDELQSENLVGQDVDDVFIDGDTNSWAAIIKADSGQWYQVTSKNTTPVELVAATPIEGAEHVTAVALNLSL